jgi:hypothetical protein
MKKLLIVLLGILCISSAKAEWSWENFKNYCSRYRIDTDKFISVAGNTVPAGIFCGGTGVVIADLLKPNRTPISMAEKVAARISGRPVISGSSLLIASLAYATWRATEKKPILS